MLNPKLGIIIEDYNGEKYTNSCIRGTLKSSY